MLPRRYVFYVSHGLFISDPFLKLIFSLNSARDWKQEHGGFYYPSFYNFVVDFFEDDDDDILDSPGNRLLRWWNRYVLHSYISET